MYFSGRSRETRTGPPGSSLPKGRRVPSVQSLRESLVIDTTAAFVVQSFRDRL